MTKKKHTDYEVNKIKVFLATLRSKHNHLIYVMAILTPFGKQSGITIKCLIDSGASKTLVCYNAISSQIDQGIFTMRPPPKGTVMESALQATYAKILGVMDVTFYFGKTTASPSISTSVYVMSGLNQMCFLGSDLMQEDKIVAITKDSIIINPMGEKVPSLDIPPAMIPVKTFRQEVNASETVLSMTQVQFPEKGQLAMKLYRSVCNNTQNASMRSEDEEFRNMLRPEEDLTVLGHAQLNLPPRTATSSPHWPNTDERDLLAINHLAVYESQDASSNVSPAKQTQWAQSKRSSHKALRFSSDPPFIADKSRSQSLMDTCMAEPSTPNIFDWEKSDPDEIPCDKNEKPKSTTQMLSAVDMSHLPPDEAKLYRALLIDNIDIFSRTSTDIGCTHLFTGHVFIKEGLNPADFQQKHIPFPMHHRQGVSDLLRDLLTACIIRKAPHPVRCLTNMHVLVKPSGNLRLILDSRATNYFTERFAAVTTFDMKEVLTKLRDRMVSMVDVSQSFFNIPLTEEAMEFFSFLGPDKTVYQLTRVAQGHHNSPTFQAHAMEAMLSLDAKDDVPEEMPQQPAQPDIDHMVKEDDPIQLFNVYDDLIIASDKEDIKGDGRTVHQRHRAALQLLFNKIRKANMKLRIEKLQLAPRMLTILGMNFDSRYLHIPPKRFAAWYDMPVKTPRQAKGFVASLAYFRSFCPSFSIHAFPLIKFTKKEQYGPQMEKAKLTLLETMERNCKIRVIHKDDHLILSTDASKFCAAATLEVLDRNKTELIASFSKLFTPAEINRDIFAKEAATIIYAIEAFSYYLNGCSSFTLRTDVRGILYIRFTKMKNQVSYRLASTLARYNPTIIHIPTSAHAISDALSRRTTTDDMVASSPPVGLTPKEAEALLKTIHIQKGKIFTQEEAATIISEEALKSITKPCAEPKSLQPPSSKPPTAPKHTIVRPNFVRETASNNAGDWRKHVHKRPRRIAVNLSTISEEKEREKEEEEIEKLENPSPNLPVLRAAANLDANGSLLTTDFIALQQQDPEINFYLSNDAPSITRNKEGVIMKGNKIYLPQVLVTSAVEAIHRSVPSYHTPQGLTLRQLASKYFRKNLQHEVGRVYANCFICTLSSPKRMVQPPLASQYAPKAPREAWYIDIMDVTNKATSANTGKRYAIVAVDAFSNYTVVAPIATRTKDEMSTALIANVIAPFGKPFLILSDNESSIAADACQNLLEANAIKCHLISPKSPWANKAERAIQAVKQCIKSAIVMGVNYINILPTIMQQLNSTPFSAKGCNGASPELLFYQREFQRHSAPLPPLTDFSTDSEIIRKIQSAVSALHAARERKRAHANRRRKERVYEQGEIVFLREPTAQLGQRLLAPAGQLYVVRERAGPQAYWLDNITTKASVKRHAAFIFPAEIGTRAQLLSPTWDSNFAPKGFTHPLLGSRDESFPPDHGDSSH